MGRHEAVSRTPLNHDLPARALAQAGVVLTVFVVALVCDLLQTVGQLTADARISLADQEYASALNAHTPRRHSTA